MTERDLYDAALIEINKLEAPSMLLEDYNYFINKAIQQYINKTCNRYEINQQATDDLAALKKSTSLLVYAFSPDGIPNEIEFYFGVLPKDYMHMLNCVVKFKRNNFDTTNCNKDFNNPELSFLATKLTSDIYPSIINNAYLKPSYRRPYYTTSEITKEYIQLEKILNPCVSLPLDKEGLLSNILDPCGGSE